MKHNIQYYIATILLLGLLCACEEDLYYEEFSFTPPSWNVVMSSGDADWKSIEIHVYDIEGYYSWSAESSTEWLTCTREGYSSGKLKLAVDENTTSAERTATVSITDYNGQVAATINVTQPGLNKKDGYWYVDLGLPSGLLWATRNVGASRPEGDGNLYAWGETSTKSDYSSSTSLTYGKTTEQLKKLGIIGSDGNLTPAYDAARVAWGGTWRMPTREEIKELSDNTTSTEITLSSGKKGYRVTSKKNGNSILLPFSFWSSSLKEGSSEAYSSNSYSYRYYGCSIRPVTEP